MNKFSLSSLPKDTIITGVLALVALVAVLGAGYIVEDVPADSSLSRQARQQEIRTLKERTILEHTVIGSGADARVAYVYVGERLPELFAENEVTALRSETSWTKQTGTAPDGRAIYESIIYSQPQFVNHKGAWHYREYDTASLESFERSQSVFLFSHVFTPVAHAALLNRYSLAGDGHIQGFWTAWANVQSTTSPTFGTGSYTATLLTVGSEHHTNTGKFDLKSTGYYIHRGFLPFDTSFLPYGSSISAATLNVVASTTTNTDNDGADYITVAQSSQADEYILQTTDYALCGNTVTNPTEGIDTGQRKDITSISTGAYLTFTLNSTGRSWIKKKGETSNCGQSANYIVITSGTSWDVPYDWDNASNTIQVIGGGGGGKTGTTNANGGGGGGGGGAFSEVTNVALPAGETITIAVGVPGVSDGGNGGDTYLCNSTSNCASIAGSAVIVGAKGGTGGSDPGAGTQTGGGGAGGSSASGVGTTKYSGGNGGDRNGGGGGGGGGAAGQNGAGGNGSAGSTTIPRGGGGGGGANGGGNATQGTTDGGVGGTNRLGAGAGAAGTGGGGGGGGTSGGGGGGGDGSATVGAGSGGFSSNEAEYGAVLGGASSGTGGGAQSTGSSTQHGFAFSSVGFGGGAGGGGGGNNGGSVGSGGQGATGAIIIRYANNKTGSTCLCLREGHDTTNSSILTDTANVVNFISSEWSGTSSDPYLAVTYTAPFAFWQFMDY